MSSSRNFMVLGLTLKVLIHFQFSYKLLKDHCSGCLIYLLPM